MPEHASLTSPSADPRVAQKPPYIGGQAVLEGVMMRSPRSFSVVVRRASGALVVRERPMAVAQRRLGKYPFFRGVASLVESLRLGSEALRFSADHMEKDLEEEERASAAKAGPPTSLLGVLRAIALSFVALATVDPGGAPAPLSERKKGGNSMMAIMLVVVIVFLIALPQATAAGINRWLRLGLEVQSPAFQAITGFFKLAIVVGYLALIRQSKDIRRVFQYHGAEHKTISTYEADEALTVNNARSKSTLHPRCGTTFLVMVAVVSILVFSAVGEFLPRIHTGNAFVDNAIFFFEKFPFLPVIVGVTFELQRLSARYCTTGPLRAFLWPGFLVQKITTIEPDDAQLEVALAALKATLLREGGTETSDDVADVTFPGFAAFVEAARLRSEQGPSKVGAHG